MNVVFDCGVVFAGAGWRTESHRCLVAMAQRRVLAWASPETLAELQEVAVRRRDYFPHPAGADRILEWYYERVKVVNPAALGKPISRDAKDDPYLACALAAAAKVIVSRDPHLLDLKKPFGIRIMTPRALLSVLAHPELEF